MPSVQTPTVESALGVMHVALPPAHGAPVSTEYAYDLFCELPAAIAIVCVAIASNPLLPHSELTT